MESLADLFHMGRMVAGTFFVLVCVVYVVLRLALGKEKTDELYEKGDRPIGGGKQ